MNYKLFYILIIFLITTIGSGWTYTIPPNSIFDNIGFRFGNTNISATSIVTDNISSTNISVVNITTTNINGVNFSSNLYEPYSYLIYTDGMTIFAKNGTTGKIDFSGTNASYVVQSSLDSLTSSRTWSESIYLTGNMTFPVAVSIPKYTSVYQNGRITTGGTNYAWNINASTRGEIYEIKLFDSNIYGQKGIYINNAYLIGIYNTLIHLSDATNSVGINITNSNDIDIIGGNIFGSGKTGNSTGIELGLSGTFANAAVNQIKINMQQIGSLYYGIKVGNDISQDSNILITADFIQNNKSIYNRNGVLDVRDSWFEDSTFGVYCENSGTYTPTITINKNYFSLLGGQYNLYSEGYCTWYIYNYFDTFAGSGSFYLTSGNTLVHPIDMNSRTSQPTAISKGDTYFNTTSNKPCYYNGTTWNTYSDVSGC